MSSELFKCEPFTVYSHNRQVGDFLADLSRRDWLRFVAVVKRLTLLLLTGAPALDRIEKVKGATNKLYELKIAPPGSKGPQPRALCLVDGRRIVCLRGIDKRQPKLRPADVRSADRIAGAYLRSQGELARERKSKKGSRGRKGRKDPP
jgi:hypothetical protein